MISSLLLSSSSSESGKEKLTLVLILLLVLVGSEVNNLICLSMEEENVIDIGFGFGNVALRKMLVLLRACGRSGAKEWIKDKRREAT